MLSDRIIRMAVSDDEIEACGEAAMAELVHEVEHSSVIIHTLRLKNFNGKQLKPSVI